MRFLLFLAMSFPTLTLAVSVDCGSALPKVLENAETRIDVATGTGAPAELTVPLETAAARGVTVHRLKSLGAEFVMIDEQIVVVFQNGKCVTVDDPAAIARFGKIVHGEDRPEPISLVSDLAFSFVFDGSISHRFAASAARLPTPLRYYDNQRDAFSLNLVELSVEKPAAPVGFVMRLGFGEWVELNFPRDTIARYLTEGYLRAAPNSMPGLEIEAGKLFTHIGLEAPRSIDNFNYSRSFLYGFALPFWHVGVRASQRWGGDVKVMLAAYNGAGTSVRDENEGKTLGWLFSIFPDGPMTVTYGGVAGPEQPGTELTWRVLNDLNVVWAVDSKLDLAADAVIGTEAGTHWIATEVLARLRLPSFGSVSGRLEYYSDPDGVTLGQPASALLGATLSVSSTVSSGVEMRVEGRYDRASVPLFDAGQGKQDSQATVSVALLSRF